MGNFNYQRQIPVDKTRHRLRVVKDKALPRHSKYAFRKAGDVMDLRMLIAIHEIGKLERRVFVYRK